MAVGYRMLTPMLSISTISITSTNQGQILRDRSTLRIFTVLLDSGRLKAMSVHLKISNKNHLTPNLNTINTISIPMSQNSVAITLMTTNQHLTKNQRAASISIANMKSIAKMIIKPA